MIPTKLTSIADYVLVADYVFIKTTHDPAPDKGGSETNIMICLISIIAFCRPEEITSHLHCASACDIMYEEISRKSPLTTQKTLQDVLDNAATIAGPAYPAYKWFSQSLNE